MQNRNFMSRGQALACALVLAGVAFFAACEGAGFKGGLVSPTLTGNVVITGTAQVGQMLTANTAGLDGNGTISFQWRRGGVNVGTNGMNYRLSAADIGQTITVTVTRASHSGNITSPAVGPVTQAGLPDLTGNVVITGTPQVGQTLAANTAGLGGTGAISFQWRRGGVNVGTNSNSYVVQAADVGQTITVTVTRAGNSGNITSSAVGPVVAAPASSPHGFVRIPGGTFLMGSPVNTSDSHANERPVRAVTISAFYMGRFPVTQGEWYDVMGTNPSYFHSGVATGVSWRNLPVERVTWYYALVFSNRLSIMRGLSPAYSIGGSTNPDDWGPVPTTINATWNAVTVVHGSTGYRLPTEAQWEFAARGGNGSPGNFTFSGSNNAAEVAWNNANSGGRTHEVGALMPNALGLYDMSGNVSEWVWDWFGTYPSMAQTDPTGPAAGDFRMARGGSWNYAPADTRSAVRFVFPPNRRGETNGFRLVRP